MIPFKAHVDAAGGSGKDSYAVALAFRDPGSERIVLAAVREVRPQFSPEAVTAEFSALLKSYGVFEATADQFAGSWPREQFAKHGVSLIPSPKTTSELFLEFLPLLNSGRVELLDDKVVINQLCNLERRAGRGRDFIAAGGTGHDDVACVVAGSIVAAAREEDVPLCDCAVDFVNAAGSGRLVSGSRLGRC